MTTALRRIALVPAALSVCLCSALAQVTVVGGPRVQTDAAAVVESDSVLRVTVGFRVPIPAMQADPTTDTSMLATARRNLYQQAQRECLSLAEIFQRTDCQLASLQIAVGANSPNGAFIAPVPNPQPPPPPTLAATAVYFLRKK